MKLHSVWKFVTVFAAFSMFSFFKCDKYYFSEYKINKHKNNSEKLFVLEDSVRYSLI